MTHLYDSRVLYPFSGARYCWYGDIFLNEPAYRAISMQRYYSDKPLHAIGFEFKDVADVLDDDAEIGVITTIAPDVTSTQLMEQVRSRQEQYFAKVNELDTGQVTNNPHILANRWQRDKIPVTPDMLSTLIPRPAITAEAFTYISTVPEEEWYKVDLPLTNDSRQDLRQVIGSTTDASVIKVSGIYRFVHIESGEVYYIGGGKTLGKRALQHIIPSYPNKIRAACYNMYVATQR